MNFFVVDQQIIAEATKEITQRVSAEAFGTLDSFCVLFRIHIDMSYFYVTRWFVWGIWRLVLVQCLGE